MAFHITVLSHSHICRVWGGGQVVKRESPDFRSPEVGISAAWFR